MVSFDNSKQLLTQQDFLIGGCLSGLVSRACVQPLDVIKVRFQLQVEPISNFESSSKYKSFLQAIQCIIKEEGILAFWKGHASSQVLAVSFSGVQFASFEAFTRWLHSEKFMFPKDSACVHSSPSFNFVCGFLAGVTSATVTQPLDVLKTRFIAQGEPRIYNNIGEAIACICRREGLQGFFKGLSPSLLLTAPQTGLQFAFYRLANRLIGSAYTKVRNFTGFPIPIEDNCPPTAGILQNLTAGAIAGVGAKFLVYPLDVAKTRLQVQGFEKARSAFGRVHTSKGLTDCFLIMCREEGPTALYKGLKTSMLKACVSIGCRFTIYEEICSLLSLRHKQSVPKP